LQDVVGQLADRPQRMVWAHALLRREVTIRAPIAADSLAP
jgi:hypothetical protein